MNGKRSRGIIEAQIDEHYLVIAVIDNAIELSFEFCQHSRRKCRFEYGKLDSVAIGFADTRDVSEALGIRNIIANEIFVAFHRVMKG